MHKGEEVEFELFEPGQQPNLPAVSISKQQSLKMNQAAWEGLGSPQYVRLFYNRDKKEVGIRPAPTKERNALKVSTSRSTHFVSATGYVRRFEIPHNPTKRYLANIEMDGEGPTGEEGPELWFSLNDEPIWVGKKSTDRDKQPR